MTTHGRNWRRLVPAAVTAVLLALLATLGFLQWHWIGDLSAGEHRRVMSNLAAAGDRFADDFQRQLVGVLFAFHPDVETLSREPADWLSERWERWQSSAPRPGLVRGLSLYTAGQDVARCFVPAQRDFAPCHRPPLPAAALARSSAERPGPAIFTEVPALAVPLPQGGRVVIELDRATLREEILPELTERYFESERGEDYAVALFEGEAQRLFYGSDPEWDAAAYRDADLLRSLGGLGPLVDGPSPMSRSRGGPRARRAHATAGWPHSLLAGRHRQEHLAQQIAMPRMPGDGAGWTLAIKRRSHSVDEAVAIFRFHNLAISLCILGLIGVTTVVMTVSAQRAQRLARQQLEFVAGVTHELHTPLTAICSAGENLADGVVSSPEQVKRYGELVEREGRRLHDMVAQSLEMAGIQSGRRVYRRERVEVPALIEDALAASRWLVADGGVEVERHVEPELPAIEGDAAALERALRNLIENAVKYGGEERWLAVRARRAARGVEIEVADRGPGVAREELPRLFEPFVRGRAAAGKPVPGSGLGLSLVRHVVEAHGGRVTVAKGDGGRGAAFVIHLPAAAA